MEPLVLMHPVDRDFTLEAPERHRPWYEQIGYERMSSALFQTVVVGADVVLDIGAHMGYYSLLAKSAAPGTAVVAVEASPENAEVLRRNVARAVGPAVEVVGAAFGAAKGTTTLQVTEASDNAGLSGHPNSPTTATVEVDMVSSAELDLPAGRRLVVKLDVEGHEIAALRGLEAAFARYEDVRLFVELNPKCLRYAGSSADALIDRLFGFGFRLFVLDEEGWRWHEIRPDVPWEAWVDPTSYANLYCVPAERCRTVSAVLHAGGVGGAERSHTEMVASLVRQGAMVHTVAPEPDLGVAERLRRLGSSVDVVPPIAWWATDGAATDRAPSAAGLLDETVLTRLEDADADVVLTQTMVVPQGAIAAAALDKPHVWYVREFGDLDHGLTLPGGAARTGEAILALSDLVLVNSRAVADHYFGAGASSVRVLAPAPVVAPVVAPAAPRQDDGSRPWTLGVVAALNEGKGQADAVRAVARLRGEGLDVHLALVGPGPDDERAALQTLADELGVGDLVSLRGAVADPVDAYAGLDAVAVTSRSEAFGRVPFEATSYSLPLVYANAGGLVEYMTPGITGLPYEPGDVPALADAIQRLHDDPGLAADLVRHAGETLLSDERREHFDREIHDLLQGLAARRPRPVVEGFLGDAVREASHRLRSTREDLARLVAEHVDVVERYHELEEVYRAEAEAHVVTRGETEKMWAALTSTTEHRDQLAAERDRLAVERDGLAAERDRLAAERDGLAAERDGLAAERDGLAAERDRLAVERDDAETRLAASRRELALVEGSRTWRLRARLQRLAGRGR